MSSDPVTPAPGGPETACCAHMRVSFRTEEVPWDGPDGEQSVLHPEQVPIRRGQMLTRGWWACDDCDHHFSPIPLAASRGSARPAATPPTCECADWQKLQPFKGLQGKPWDFCPFCGREIGEARGDGRPPEGATREPADELWAAYRAGYIDGVSNPKADVEGYEAWCALAEAGASAFVATNRIANNIARQKWNAERRADAGDAEPGEGARGTTDAAIATMIATSVPDQDPPGVAEVEAFHREAAAGRDASGKIIDLMAALKESSDFPKPGGGTALPAGLTLCRRCEKPEWLHRGSEQFCPIYCTFAPASAVALPAEPRPETPRPEQMTRKDRAEFDAVVVPKSTLVRRIEIGADPEDAVEREIAKLTEEWHGATYFSRADLAPLIAAAREAGRQQAFAEAQATIRQMTANASIAQSELAAARAELALIDKGIVYLKPTGGWWCEDPTEDSYVSRRFETLAEALAHVAARASQEGAK